MGSNLPRVAIALGDPAGIGPEAALDAHVTLICRPLLFGDPGVLATHARCCSIDVPIDAFRSARAAIEAALAGDLEAVVAAPQTERLIKEAGIEFDGYPSFVARCTGLPPEDAFLMIRDISRRR